ncbi:SSU ribosomal protein S6P modification protein [Arboricoccus pini]|uniref:SSU ribosomal protein S6P modification protein n=1 Tax=Arboricoccus pini TaxID=1963835 RepID=A0A212S0B6_9PROT|nr:RimK family alpha-L-glutamate ligase [Arboricoccus pini]SNB78401.1 SSU ribosomal protein S6P modification protein [Arboricoccus pini]
MSPSAAGAAEDASPFVLLLGAAGWHKQQLVRAFTAKGATAKALAFERCGFAVDGPSGLALGPHRRLPDAVLVRSIPDGSFEQVTLRLSILHALDALGVPVAVAPRAIERCVDKAHTTFLLQAAGLPVPLSWALEDPEQASERLRLELAAGHKLVQKPLFGSQGKGLKLLAAMDDLPPPEAVDGVYYLQRFVETGRGFEDFRVFVVDGRPVAAMRRQSQSWITNVKQGGVPEAVLPEGSLGAFAVRAAEAIGALYAGVDLIRDATGQLYVLEVNSMPAWQGLQSVVEIDIAGEIAAALLSRIPAFSAAA